MNKNDNDIFYISLFGNGFAMLSCLIYLAHIETDSLSLLIYVIGIMVFFTSRLIVSVLQS